MKVSIYARYSTDLQDKTSIAGQVSNCEALAAREGFDVVTRFADEGISGSDDSRPQYQAMLKRLKAGDFVGIVCDETSRITRNQAELHRLVAELNFRDHFLITCDGIDTRNESAALVLAVKAAVDQMEGRKIGYRTYRSLRERHKDGHSAGGKIFGYTSEQDGEYRRRVINPEQAEVIKEIFERYAEGESARQIVRDFNERGVPSPGSYWKNRRSLGWVHTTLLGSQAKASGILRNPIYTGRVTWNKRTSKKVPGTGRRIQKRRPESEWIEYRDELLRIVSDKLFDRVQARLRNARNATNAKNKRGRPPRYLLSGLLKCKSCGAHYTVRNGIHYRCSSQTNGRDAFCDQRRLLRREKIEDLLLTDIKRQLLAPDFVKEITKRIRAEAQKGSHASDPSNQTVRAAHRRIDRQINDLAETICEVGRSDILTAKLKELEAERRSLREPVSSLTTTAKLLPGATEKWREVVENLGNLNKVAKPHEMEAARKALRGIIGEVTVVEEGDHILAYPMISKNAVYKGGAEKRT